MRRTPVQRLELNLPRSRRQAVSGESVVSYGTALVAFGRRRVFLQVGRGFMRASESSNRWLARAWIAVRVVAAATVIAASGWMLWRLSSDDRLATLATRRLDFRLIAAATVLCAGSQLLYFARWHWLARTLGVPLGRREAVLAAATAQLLGSLAFGAAAADIFRALANAARCAGHRVGLVASILADRLSGLYALVCLAAIAAVAATSGSPEWTTIRIASLPVLWGGVFIGGGCFLLGLLVNLGPILDIARRWPVFHALVVRVLSAIDRFRSAPGAIVLAIVAGILVHWLNAAGLWLLAGGLLLPRPSLAAHCLILPLAACTGLLPLPMAGLGAVEVIIDGLYKAAMPESSGAGLVASLALRIVSLAANAAIVAVFAGATRIRPATGRVSDAVSS